MLNRVAVLSDIHGALPALEAVLAEPDVAAADLIVLTGDIAAGPQPVEVLDVLAGLGDRACWVRGNADRELVEARAGRPSRIDVSNWAAEQLRDDQVARLAALPLTVTMEIGGLGPVLFCHATPRDDEEVVLVDSRMERWTEVLADVPAEVGTVVCGHTHMPFTRLADRRLIVNPGSIGMPYGGPGAFWALLGPGVHLRRTPFDVDAACARVAAESGFPDAAAWADEYLRSQHSDADALAVFAPRDGR
ncbi:metallophosphatase family protein [Micromonospora peucetia]|uniref:metallophosphoesterase family protein n=1 Tax=Micromonospora peucetia TaxID=47871 RepID=UPI002251B0B3|nr:metallophosphoesterase family protein [Micromonospora peucetia]MCX4389038.1 metallophosphatase family protein [Micromonospora peucetia]